MVGLAVVAIVVGVLSGRGGSQSSNEAPNIQLVNDQPDVNAATNINQNANTNTSVVANADPEIEGISNTCKSVVTSVGTQPLIALTYDIAADNEAINTLLEKISSQSIPTSFFVTGSYAAQHVELLQRIADAGIRVYSRGTASSKRYATLSASAVRQDLAQADESIEAAAGRSPKPFFRPPDGETSPEAVTAALEAGFCTVTWSIDTLDWDDTQTVDGAVQRVIDRAKAGHIILMHAGYDITADLTDRLATELVSRGFRLVTLSELFATVSS